MRGRTALIAMISLMVAGLLVTLPGSQSEALPTLTLVNRATGDVDFQAASASADVVSSRWAKAEPFPPVRVSASELWANNGIMPAGNEAGRRMGLSTQVQRIFLEGDPLVGDALNSDNANAQDYADAAVGAPTIERGYARASAVIFFIRTGFAIVPGGPAEAFNRIQTCLNGNIETNQDNLVSGVALDCSAEAIRRAVADLIAPGFYLGFGELPAVDFSCEDILKQAESGTTVEARWAAAKAYVFGCSPDLSAVAKSGGSAELQFAAVWRLANNLAGKEFTAEEHLGHVDQFRDAPELATAHAWAAGLLLEKEVDADPFNCAPTTPTTGNLDKFSAANLGLVKGGAAIAPLARFFTADIALPNGKCQFDLGQREQLRLTITKEVSGAELPLMSFINTLR